MVIIIIIIIMIILIIIIIIIMIIIVKCHVIYATMQSCEQFKSCKECQMGLECI